MKYQVLDEEEMTEGTTQEQSFRTGGHIWQWKMAQAKHQEVPSQRGRDEQLYPCILTPYITTLYPCSAHPYLYLGVLLTVTCLLYHFIILSTGVDDLVEMLCTQTDRD